jgi:hypothetical protein
MAGGAACFADESHAAAALQPPDCNTVGIDFGATFSQIAAAAFGAQGAFFMEFIHSRPDVVRSKQQRWLLDYWSHARGGQQVPIWQGLDDMAAVCADLSYTQVVPAEDGPRFLIQFHGTRVAELFGRENCVGKFLDEILPAAYRHSALTTYRETVAQRLPVYTVADMRDRGGRIVHYERLLLPFGTACDRVDCILTLLETLSPEGDFDTRALMQAPRRPPAFALCTTIGM